MSLVIKKEYNDEKNMWEVALDGEVDIYTAGELRETLNKIIKEKKETINLNATNLHYIDSTGLGVLIGIFKKLKESDKKIILYNVKPNINKLLHITGLEKVFTIER